jgi:L-threonylcarbamoyladenylate synthase
MNDIDYAVEQLKLGQIIAVPTETVYGLAVDAFNDNAIESLFDIKGRPKDKPFVFQVDSIEKAQLLVASSFTEFQIKLMNKYWPGDVTFIFNKNNNVSLKATANKNTIAIRISKHPQVIALLQKFGAPLAIPSANKSDKQPAVTAKEVREIFKDKIKIVLENVEEISGNSSTIVDIRSKDIYILRQGDTRVIV